ncbi:MAG: flavodoxin-dependent (E)-4-hydroxy-3-methylbut-2-enyl-diphosphate synthase, partial [Clostridia bacterium]|nr:flavodoxin-dependent (E)-4-hydroxy-3-methylbut-2-enyl-diphosphate synthase [Clostridia bacterium]
MYTTREVHLGPLTLGGNHPVWVQSMTNTDTRDAAATLAQIRALADAGCDIVRCSVYDEACAKAVRTLVDGSPVPVVADIHYNHRLAIAAAENGIHKLRINPGNIGGENNDSELAAAAKAHHIPIRIGVNTGSIEKDILHKYGGPCAEGLVESAL